jgi:hypothetical protein
MSSLKPLNNPELQGNETERLVELRAFSDLVENAMKRAVKEAIAAHHRAGNPVAIWKDGQVVLWYPDGSYVPVPSAPAESDVPPD